MADTFVKIPKILVGTQAQVESEMTTNDIGFATDIRFYNATETDTLLASKQPVGDYATNEALSSGLATKQPVGDYATNSALASGLALKVAIAQGAENAGKILKIDDSGNVIVADESGGASLPILYHTWADHLLNDISWLRADTFSWHSGDVYKAAYEHLADDVNAGINRVEWHTDGTVNICYTRNINPQVGDSVYSDTSLTTEIGVVEATGSGITVSNNKVYHFYAVHSSGASTTETIAGVQIRYFLASDGHKICLPNQEENISALYEATGSADYYILDTTNTQFKLPRKQKRTLIQAVNNTDGTWYNLYSDGYVEQGGYVDGGTSQTPTFPVAMSDTNYTVAYGNRSGTYEQVRTNTKTTTSITIINANGGGTVATDWQVSGYAAESEYASAGMRLEYYYVGNFEQSAIEQTAGLNTELFNGKADTDLGNIPANYDYIVESQLPTADNNYNWYRKYKSGWVEQGGFLANTANGTVVSLLIEMANVYFDVHIQSRMDAYGSVTNTGSVGNVTTTSFIHYHYNDTNQSWSWQVSGYAA